MKALSLLQPWPWAIFCLPPDCWKDCENRKWKLRQDMIGERAVFHSSLGWDSDGWMYLYNLWRRGLIPDKPPVDVGTAYPRGKLLGEVTLVDDQLFPSIAKPSMWQFDVSKNDKPSHCFGLAARLSYNTPLAWKGSLGFWDVPDEVVQILRKGSETSSAERDQPGASTPVTQENSLEKSESGSGRKG